MVDPDKLVKAFNQMLAEPQLNRTIGVDYYCQVQMWILQIQEAEKTVHRLIFGWIIPSNYSDDKWYKSDVTTGFTPVSKAYRASIFKYTLFSNGQTVASIIENLLSGATLGESCEKLNVKPPKGLTPFQLERQEELGDSYLVRPPVFMETNSRVAIYQDNSKPFQSPSNDVPSYVGSVFRLKKFQLWSETESSDFLDEVDLLAKYCISALAEQTGLDFKGSDSGRLGNLEWMAFPLDNKDEPPADWAVIKGEVSFRKPNGVVVKAISSREVEVFLNEDTPDLKDLLIRCRLRNDNEVMSDQCRIVNVRAAKQGIRFVANQEICRMQLTIWTPSGNRGNWDIWYDYEAPLIRQVNIAMGVVGLQGQVKLSTLKEVQNSDKVKDRVARYEAIRQLSYHNSQTGDYTLDPWVISSREIGSYVKALFPPVSGAKFFPKGWGNDGPGVLSFAEWFRSLTDRTSSGTVMIIDPYFDTVGIELISHANTTNTAFEVITSTQIRSNDDTSPSRQQTSLRRLLKAFKWILPRRLSYKKHRTNPEPQRAVRIQDTCRELRQVLLRLKLTVWDIRSVQGGTGAYFHDRYMLVLGPDEQIVEGYHLSNSLQAVTRFAPLLITPIPPDILEDVASYVDNVKHARPPVVEKASALKLYPFQENQTRPLTLPPISAAGQFFAILLDCPHFLAMDSSKQKERLIDEGLLAPDASSFLVDSEENMLKRMASLSDRMTRGNQIPFASFWYSYSMWLANLAGSDIYLHEFSRQMDQRLCALLYDYLSNSSEVYIERERIDPNQEAVIQAYCRFIRLSFNEALDDAYNYLEGRHFHHLGWHFHLTYAAEALLTTEPSIVVQLLEQLQTRILMADGAACVISSYLLHGLISHLQQNPMSQIVPHLLTAAQLPSLRAMGSQQEWFRMEHETMTSFASGSINIPLLHELRPIERLYAYAEWIYHFRISVNTKGLESEPQAELRKNIFLMLQSNWQTELSSVQKTEIIYRLCGPSVGSWTNDIYHDLMVPLVANQVMNSDEAVMLWIDLLLSKIYQDKKSESFYGATDRPLTELCARLLGTLTDKAWGDLSKRIDKLINDINREVRTPFGNKVNFQKWNFAQNAGIWMAIFLEKSYHQSMVRKEEIKQFADRLDKGIIKNGRHHGELSLYASETF